MNYHWVFDSAFDNEKRWTYLFRLNPLEIITPCLYRARTRVPRNIVHNIIIIIMTCVHELCPQRRIQPDIQLLGSGVVVEALEEIAAVHGVLGRVLSVATRPVVVKRGR